MGRIYSTTLKQQGDLIGVTSVKNSKEVLEKLKLGNNNKDPGIL